MSSEVQKVYDIFYRPDINSVVMDWDGYATSAEFREGTETMLNLLIENRVHKVLADVKDMVIIGMDDQKWMETNFLPRAIRFGIKACAIIKSDSYFNQVALESVSYKVDKDKLIISFFDTKEEAIDWLNGLSF